MTANNYKHIGELDSIIDDLLDITAELMMARSIITRAEEKSSVATGRLESWKRTHLDKLKAAFSRKAAA